MDEVPLDEFLQPNVSKYDWIKDNLLNATLTFNQRVRMFMKHIVMIKGSPVGIQNYSYKIYFALKGAAHMHGVLWLDWKNINALEKNDINQISKAFDNVKKDLKLDDAQKKAVTKLADKYISCSLKIQETENADSFSQGFQV